MLSSAGRVGATARGARQGIERRQPLRGRIVIITVGEAMTDVTIAVGNGQTIVATITRSSVDRMGLAEEDAVMAIVKVTEVIIGKQAG